MGKWMFEGYELYEDFIGEYFWVFFYKKFFEKYFEWKEVDNY